MSRILYRIILWLTIIVMIHDLFWVFAPIYLYQEGIPEQEQIIHFTLEMTLFPLLLISYVSAFSKLRLYGPMFAVIILRIWNMIYHYDINEFYWLRETWFDADLAILIGGVVIIIYYMLYLIDVKSRANKWLVIYGSTGLILVIIDRVIVRINEDSILLDLCYILLSLNPILTTIYFKSTVVKRKTKSEDVEVLDDL